MSPLVTAPNLIEASDFSSGWHPDQEASAVPPNGLLNVMNLLPDIGSGTLEVRKGYKRLTEALEQGYVIQSLHPYNRIVSGVESQYLMAVATNGVDDVAGNVIVYAHNLRTGDTTMVSPNTAGTPTKQWLSGDGRHGGAVVNNVFYGFPPKDPMYAWDPTGGWKNTPATPSFPVWNSGTTFSSDDRPHDFAFEKGDQVLYTDPVFGQRAYEADRDIRYEKWRSGKRVRKGARRSVRSGTYWRSFVCRKAHKTASGNKPGSGGSWEDFWDEKLLDEPADEDGVVAKDWNLIPSAPTTSVAVWHGERLFARADSVGSVGHTRLQFSPPSKPKKGSDISELQWDPKDWRIGDLKGNKEGDGGGWEDFRSSDGDPITALRSLGFYLLVFKRKSSWVIAGLNRKTWNKRLLGDVGCIGMRALTEHENLIYFIGDEGLFVTDGTKLERVQGSEKVTDWLRSALDWEEDTKDISMWSFGGYVWASLPTGTGRVPNRVLVYDPRTQSFWLMDLEVQAAAVNRLAGVDQLFFAKPTIVGDLVTATFEWLGDKHRSQSKKTLSAVETFNLFLNPSFEPAPKVGNPAVVEDWETITEAQTSSGWNTTSSSVFFKKLSRAAMRGKLGGKVKNKHTSVFHGITQSFADLDTDTHIISGYFKKPNWKKNRKVDYSRVRLYVDAVLPEGDHTYTYVGRGWWRVSATYVGSLTSRAHGFRVKPKLVVYADKMLCTSGGSEVVYFDGDGTDEGGAHAVEGGDLPLIFQYDHPDVQDAPMDDRGGAAHTPDLIRWHMQTAWFPFGALREDRRIRRIWALVRGQVAVMLRGFRSYSDDPEFEAEEVPDETLPTTFFEGRTLPDAYAVSVSAEGLGAPAAVLGVAVDTQPRRVRYHSG